MELNKLEFFMPFIILIGLVFLLYYFKDTFRNNKKLDKSIRIGFGLFFLVVYSSHYILRYNLYGFDTIILPFHLCSVSMFLAIVLSFTKNRTIYTYVIFTGVLGGIISFLTPVIGYDSHYYRYFQFYIAHTLLIITPLYFMFVHNYFPTKKDTIYAFYILQGLAIFMGFFNYFMNTDFMFIFVDPNKIDKFPLIAKFGGIPYYLILVEVVAIGAFYLLYRLCSFIEHFEIRIKEIKYKKV
jgi:hypothetical integral membrane protein (TIGR02206 family)